MPAKKAKPTKKVKKVAPVKTEVVVKKADPDPTPQPTLVTEEVTETPQNEVAQVARDLVQSPRDSSESGMLAAESEAKSESKSNKMWLGLFIGLLIGGLVGGGVIFALGMNKLPTRDEGKASLVPKASITPSPSPDLKRTDLKVQVLNGSGVAGAAGIAKTFLEGLGYEDVAVGNADSQDFDETEIDIKEDKEEYLDQLIKDLEKEYAVASDSGELEEDSDYDAVVTLGRE